MRWIPAIVAVAVAVLAPRALACMPGCSGYHLSFTGPLGVAQADGAVTITWADSIDGQTATFDLIATQDPVPVYPMHSFPSTLPGTLLTMGLSANGGGSSGGGSYAWDTSALAGGTYFLYAVFHNPPYDTLVMPFASVAVTHGGAAATPTLLVASPRGVSTGPDSAVDVALTAAPSASPSASGASTVDVYVGSPPDAADGQLIASALPAQGAQSVQWNPTGQPEGSYVFRAVLNDANGNAVASALSPGLVQVGNNGAAGCSTGPGDAAWLGLAALLATLPTWRRRSVLRKP